MHSSVRELRVKVAELRAALVSSPCEDLDSHLARLAGAADKLRHLTSELLPGVRASVPQLRAQLEALAVDLRACQRLVDHGVALQQGWAGILAAALAGYSATGGPGPLEASAGVSVRG